MNDSMRDFGPFAGRILLAAIFVIIGWGKLMDPAGTAGSIESAGLPMPTVLAWIAIIVELLGGVMLAVGFKARLAAWGLIVFTAVATVVYHPWWADPAQKIQFLKNLAVMGGLLYVAAHGAGRFAVDREERELSL